jgi:uncharacterized protein with HEPN domain
MNVKDARILDHIKMYCNDIANSIERFGNDCMTFLNDADYHNSVALCVLQIGELSVKLSDTFKTETEGEYAPWTLIKGMRNRLVHGYGEIDYEELWNTAIRDIPYLRQFCEDHISKSH